MIQQQRVIEMVKWQDIKTPCMFLALGFLFVATSLILFMQGENDGAVLIALGIGSALLLTTAMAVGLGLLQPPATRLGK